MLDTFVLTVNEWIAGGSTIAAGRVFFMGDG